jgi:hypothetical protein
MESQKINIQLPKSINPSNDFVTSFHNAYLRHIETQEVEGKGWFNIEVWNNSGVIDINNNATPIINPKLHLDIEYDNFIEDDVFLLYDIAGLNYAHFFFNFFGKCLYFDELIKTNSNLKLGILEEFYQEEGNSNFVKQWLDLYYKDSNIEIIIFKKNISYKISNLIIPQTLYSFPMSHGDDYIIDKILETVVKVPTIPVTKNGCYISRQDTIKRGWYHSRELENELELIDRIKTDLDYDIIELMDYDMIGKIQIFKSYKNIIQQSSASNINVLFSNKGNTNTIITHPKMEGWLGYKCQQFSNKSKTNLISLDGGGILTAEQKEDQADGNNLAWKLGDIDSIIEVLKQIDKGEI